MSGTLSRVDCAALECPRRATHQIELHVDTAKFELPSCADHAEMVRLGWRGERYTTRRMESKVGGAICGRCGYRGEGFQGRYGGFRCWVCFQLQGGQVPRSVEDQEWAKRVCAALGLPDPPEPKEPGYILQYPPRP